jgi:hypothetical protein
MRDTLPWLWNVGPTVVLDIAAAGLHNNQDVINWFEKKPVPVPAGGYINVKK